MQETLNLTTLFAVVTRGSSWPTQLAYSSHMPPFHAPPHPPWNKTYCELVPRTNFVMVAFQIPLIIPAIVFIFSIYLVVAPVIDDPSLPWLIATLFVLAGLLVYYPLVYKGYRMKSFGKFVLFTIKHSCFSHPTILLSEWGISCSQPHSPQPSVANAISSEIAFLWEMVVVSTN